MAQLSGYFFSAQWMQSLLCVDQKRLPKTSNCLPLCFQVCFPKKFEHVECAQNQADFKIVFLEGGGVVVVFSPFKSFILKLDVVTSVFLNIFVEDCRSEKASDCL